MFGKLVWKTQLIFVSNPVHGRLRWCSLKSCSIAVLQFIDVSVILLLICLVDLLFGGSGLVSGRCVRTMVEACAELPGLLGKDGSLVLTMVCRWVSDLESLSSSLCWPRVPCHGILSFTSFGCSNLRGMIPSYRELRAQRRHLLLRSSVQEGRPSRPILTSTELAKGRTLACSSRMKMSFVVHQHKQLSPER
jgi:hypothetical protein